MKVRAENIGIEINGKNIFSNISLSIEDNEMVAITGPSGCGKTTLLNCLGLIQDINSGKIIIGDKNVTNYNDREKTRFWYEHAAFIYQDYGIIENESVAYNITFNKKGSKGKDVESVLNKVGLKNRGEELASVLSGGEKQRLGVARAIYKKATLIYADEPTASLDAKNRQLVVDLLRRRTKEGATVILATHDERLISECDRSINMLDF